MAQHNEPWEMLADKKIWGLLSNPEREISEDYTRLLFIELFSRLKKVEMEKYALQVILFESGLASEDIYKEVYDKVKEFFEQHDEEKAKEVEFFSKTGISFVDWVNFVMNGRFQTPN